MKQFPDQTELYQRYVSIFDEERYLTYAGDELLSAILCAYQQYYRDTFYLCLEQDEAVRLLRCRLAELLHIGGESDGLDDIERDRIASEFKRRGFCFLGGKTGGFYGPYAWKTTEVKTYEVELPSGVQPYTVKLLDGFIAKSWIDYLSFGRIGTGGWTDSTGTINCVKASYDFDSEAFQVSLLKHEAQHARDLSLEPDMPSAELEYRAKLVELIYSKERKLLVQFASEADGHNGGNGHSAASHRIVSAYCALFGKSVDELGQLSVEQIRSAARGLMEKTEGAG